MKRLLQTAAATFFAVAVFSPAHALTVGTADGANGIPFGNTGGGYYYQQVYSSALFGSGLNINEISFYNSISPGGTPRAGDFHIYLSYTSGSIANFDTNAFVFPDASFVEVYSGSIPAVASGRIDLNLSTAFSYNAALGNLMLTVREFTLADSGGRLFLDTDTDNTAGIVTNSRFSAFSYNWNQGLVTGFNAVPGSAVGETPIPAVGAGLPLILGAGGLVRYWRRRKVAQAA
jgi:hypothetical protein